MERYLKSIKNELVNILNSQLHNPEVINYSSKIGHRGLFVHTSLGIGNEEPQEKWKLRTGLAIPKRPRHLSSFAQRLRISQSTIRSMPHLKESDLPGIQRDLRRNIVAVFNDNRVQIMTPSCMADPQKPKIPTASWDRVLVSHGKKS